MQKDSLMLWTWAVVVAVYLLTAVAEAWRHRVNRRFLVGVGSQEHLRMWTRLQVALSLLVLPMAIAEAYFFRAPPQTASLIVGYVMLMAGFLLRFLGISTLGYTWTLSCMELPGLRIAKSGPHRYLSDPVFAGQLVFTLGFCLMFHAIVTAAIFYTATLFLRRIIFPVQKALRAELWQEPVGRNS